ncbi:hypothetical protein GQ44DRAFT_342859 [Phaeosphaeriaceae sp. PMI808]|nr:hypothetical protein GQ44DRAFT_342859 [Phaeosphaeriaceae sp. PMI808]
MYRLQHHSTDIEDAETSQGDREEGLPRNIVPARPYTTSRENFTTSSFENQKSINTGMTKVFGLPRSRGRIAGAFSRPHAILYFRGGGTGYSSNDAHREAALTGLPSVLDRLSSTDIPAWIAYGMRRNSMPLQSRTPDHIPLRRSASVPILPSEVSTRTPGGSFGGSSVSSTPSKKALTTKTTLVED